MSLVLGPEGCGGDQHGVVSEGGGDIVGVVAGLVVEEQGEWGPSGGRDGVMEGSDDRLAILDIGDVRADEGAGGCVDVELEVEREALAVDLDGDEGPVADPLRVREVGHEGASERRLIGASTAAALGQSDASGFEDRGDSGPAERQPMVLLDVVAEGHEGPVPAVPLGQEGLELRTDRLELWRRRARRGLGRGLGRGGDASEPVLEGAERDVGALGEGVEGDVRVPVAKLEDEAAVAVAVVAALTAVSDRAGVTREIAQQLRGQRWRCRLWRRG